MTCIKKAKTFNLGPVDKLIYLKQRKKIWEKKLREAKQGTPQWEKALEEVEYYDEEIEFFTWYIAGAGLADGGSAIAQTQTLFQGWARSKATF